VGATGGGSGSATRKSRAGMPNPERQSALARCPWSWAVVLLLSCAGQPPALAAEGGSSPAEPAKLTFDGKNLKGSPPFDVSFAIEVEAGAPAVGAVYWRDRTELVRKERERARRTLRCQRRPQPCAAQARIDKLQREIDELRGKERATEKCDEFPHAWIESPTQAPESAKPAALPNRWLVTPLDANRFYGFCFVVRREKTAEERQAEVKRVRQRLIQGYEAGETGEEIVEGLVRLSASKHDALRTAVTPFAGPIDSARDSWLNLQAALDESRSEADGFDRTRRRFLEQLAPLLVKLSVDPAIAKVLSADAKAAVQSSIALEREPCPASSAFVRVVTRQDPEGLFDGTMRAEGENLRRCYLKLYDSLFEARSVARHNRELLRVEEERLGELDRRRLEEAAGDQGVFAQMLSSAHTLESRLRELLQHQAEVEGLVGGLAKNLTATIDEIVGAAISTEATADTLKSNYVGFDAGLAYAPELDEVRPYGGANFYLRPVNKDARLGALGSFRETLTRRLAFTVGLTLSGVKDDRTRADLFGSQSLVLGGGLRLSNSLRAGIGVLAFKEQDPNPTVKDTDVTTSPYLSLSFDWDVARGFGKVLFP